MAITGKFTRTTSDDGSVGEYYYDGEDKLHRDDGPAVIESNAGGSLGEKITAMASLQAGSSDTGHCGKGRDGPFDDRILRARRADLEINALFDPPLRLN